MRRPAPTTTLLLLALAAAACTEDAKLDPDPLQLPETSTYHANVRAILETNCTVCHVAGGIGPFALDGYQNAKDNALISLAAVKSGAMPPWMPSADCRTYAGERRVSPEQLALLEAWVRDAMPEGDPADYRPIATAPSPLIEAGEPDLVLAPSAGYMPKTERPDDYRCFPLAHEFEEEKYLSMSHVRPEHAELVHHVIVYLVLPQFVPQLELLDAGEPGEGYTCFGGPGTGSPQNIAAWVPGSLPNMLTDDVAIRVPKGSRLVMQMHYNTLSAESAPDRTQLELWFHDRQPPYLLNVRAFPHLGIRVAAGDANAHETRTFVNNSDETWTAVATAPHMHMLGTRISMTAVRPAGEECLIDIPRWDFNWQQSYAFQRDQLVTIAPNESVRLDCWYDNSAANQPIVNGVQLEPREVTWGEGTLDEMCLGYLAMVEPYAPLPEPGMSCPGFEDCYGPCVAAGITPRTACAMQCSNNVSRDCAQCVVPGIAQCVIEDCPTVVGDMVECLESCTREPDQQACVRGRCVPDILDFDTCARPKIEAGTCDVYASGCGVDL